MSTIGHAMFLVGLLICSEAIAQTTAFDLNRDIPRPFPVDEVYKEALAYMSDTTDLEQLHLVRALPEAHAIFGFGKTQLNYEAGDLKGYALLTYQIKMVASEKRLTFVVSDAKINGIEPDDPACWIPCNTTPYPNHFEERNARLKKDAMWGQLADGVRNHMSNLTGLYLVRSMVKGTRP